MTKINKFFLFSISFYCLILIFNTNPAYSKTIDLYFFWGSGCPHCANMAQILKDLVKQYPELKINAFEVWYNPYNQRLLNSMAEGYGVKPGGVPVIFIGEQVIEGDGVVAISNLKEAVRVCSITGCISPLEKVKVSENKIQLKWKNIGIVAGIIISIIFLISLFKKKK